MVTGEEIKNLTEEEQLNLLENLTYEEISPLVENYFHRFFPNSSFQNINSKEDYFRLRNKVSDPLTEELRSIKNDDWRKEIRLLKFIKKFCNLMVYRLDQKVASFNKSFLIPRMRFRCVLFRCQKCGKYGGLMGATYLKYCPYCEPRALRQKIKRDEDKKKRQPRFCKNPRCRKEITYDRTDKEWCSKKCLMALRRNPGLR